MKNYHFIKKYLHNDLNKIILVIVVVIGYVFLGLLAPVIVAFTVDNIINGLKITNVFFISFTQMFNGVDYLKHNLWIMAIIIIVLESLSGLGRFIRGKYNGVTSENITKRVKDDLYQHLVKLPYSYFNQASTGDLIQRCTSDVDQIRRFFAGRLSDFVYCVSMVVIAMVILFSVHWQLAVIACISMPFLIVFSWWFGVKMQKIFLECDEAESELTTEVQESVAGIRVIKAFNQEKNRVINFEEKNNIYKQKIFNIVRLMGVFWSFTEFICYLQIFLIIIVGIYFSNNGTLTLGQYFIFISYESMIVFPLRQIGRILADFGKMSVSIKRLEEVLNEQVEDLISGSTPDLKGDIIFQNVNFSYDDHQVLNNLNLKIKKNSTIAIMGKTGSGKSSLLMLLTRLYDYKEGTITINGHDLKTINRHYLRKQIGLVLQEPYLFSKSVKENIGILESKIDLNHIHQAAKTAYIHDAILEFEQGYDTLIGEKGVTLSGGQKQRIAIARTIIADNPIIIFDDSLSALDAKTDRNVQEAMLKKAKDCIKIIITHRVSSAMNADQIIVIDQKQIAENGNHEQLMLKNGLYRHLYELQQEG